MSQNNHLPLGGGGQHGMSNINNMIQSPWQGGSQGMTNPSMGIENINPYLAGAGLVMDGVGMAVEGQRARKQYKRTRSLMNKSFRQQQQLNQQGHDLSYEMWLKTNYPAQLKQMKEAGLNPAMMYGQAGQGGTTNSGSGGSASSGGGIGMMPAQMNNLLAGAEFVKTLADAKLTNERANNEANGTRQNLQAEYEQKMIELEISGDTKEYQKRAIREEAVGKAIQNRLNESGIRLNEQRMRNLENEIYQKWASVGFQGLEAITGVIFKRAGMINEVSKNSMAMPNPNTVWQQSSSI